MTLNGYFLGIWLVLEKHGLVDVCYGAEFNRLFNQWVKKGRPVEGLDRWIRSEANRCPTIPAER